VAVALEFDEFDAGRAQVQADQRRPMLTRQPVEPSHLACLRACEIDVNDRRFGLFDPISKWDRTVRRLARTGGASQGMRLRG
jgi:hypothetical protein